MIELRNISKTYSSNQSAPVKAVQSVDLKIDNGEFVLITGRSGSGKTTLLNLMAGLAKPTTGQALWDGVDIWNLPDREQSALRNQKAGFIFQFPSLLTSLNTLENVALPDLFARSAGRGDPNERAKELLKMVGLGDKLYAYPRQLSAGQQQRVVVARALLCSPSTLFADEPTSNLDEQTEFEIMDLFQSIHKSTGITVILVTHTQQLIRYGNRAIEMAGGKII
jgi:ABC-type lipoprotein export system ATPase subunit